MESGHFDIAFLDLKLNHESGLELLPQLLKDADPDVRVLSCELARSLPSEEATRHLCAMLTDEQEINVCGAAIEVLAEVGNQDALAALAACARKFPGASFLVFAIKVATDRIGRP